MTGLKSVSPATGSDAAVPPPPLVVAAISLKAIPGPDKASEVVAASLVWSSAVRADAPTDTQRWQRGADVKHFSVLRKLDSAAWPMGLQALAKVREEGLSSVKR